jgi:hypothetical protein
LNIKFSNKEQELVDLVSKTETFDEVLSASKLIFEYLNEKQQEQNSLDVNLNSNSEEESESNDSSNQETPNNNSDAPKNEGESDEEDLSDQSDSNTSADQNSGGDKSLLESKTADSFEENLQNIISKTNDDDYISYVTIPDYNYFDFVISNEKVHEYVNQHWRNWEEIRKGNNIFIDEWTASDAEYLKFKKDSAKEVNYLVKEFECKKSAASYSRASTSRTGVLDCTKLHTYKYSEDIFKRITVLPDGKNHGLI